MSDGEDDWSDGFDDENDWNIDESDGCDDDDDDDDDDDNMLLLVDEHEPISALTLRNKDRGLLDLFREQMRLCQWCNRPYLEINNIGEYNCFQHPNRFDWTGSHWYCCSRRKIPRVNDDGYTRYDLDGCVRTHHSWELRPYTEKDDLPLNAELVPHVLEYLHQSSRIQLQQDLQDGGDTAVAVNDYVVVRRYSQEDRDKVDAVRAVREIERDVHNLRSM